MLQPSAERAIPKLNAPDPITVAEHLTRYNWVKQFVYGKVLDIACGTGYGSKIIAENDKVKEVIGIDIDEDTIEYALQNYSHAKIGFVRENALNINYSEEFDCIVCFETIEHLEEDYLFVEKIYKALKKGGQLFISTPLGAGRYIRCVGNFHIREYTRQDFKELLSRFEKVDLFSQSFDKVEKDNNQGRFVIACCTKEEKFTKTSLEIRKNQREFKDELGYKQLVINLVGAFGNEWGSEHHLCNVLMELGHIVKTFDYRRGSLAIALSSPADMSLVLKGEGIPPQVIQKLPKPTVLWYGELIHPSADKADEVSIQKAKELSFNVGSYDWVFHLDALGLDTIRKLGGKNVYCLPSAFSPEANRKLNVEKAFDVGFAGNLSAHRRKIINFLKENKIDVTYKWVFGNEFNMFINRCKIFLNIHFTQLLNTETRIFEVLGSGTFCLTEEISMPEMFEEKKHLVSWKTEEDLLEEIRYYLEKEEEREKIAQQGMELAESHHTYLCRARELLEKVKNVKLHPVDFKFGVMYDKDGEITLSTNEYYEAVTEKIKSFNPLPNPLP
jgi:spore maturation protein CgeB